MSKVDSIYESKLMQGIQKWGGKLASNKAVSTITSSMMSTMGLLLCGTFFVVVASVLNMLHIIGVDSPVYSWLYVPYNMTMNVIALATAFSVGYIYSNNLQMKGSLANGMVSMILFLVVCAPMKGVALADGSSMNIIDTTYLGGTGLFPALIIGLVSIKIIHLCRTKNIVIKMPDAIPPFLQDSFTSLIPLVINILIWHGINTLLQVTMQMSFPQAIITVLAGPLAVLNSWPGMFVLVFLAMLLWSMGLHGTTIVSTPLLPIIIQTISENAAHRAAGEPLVIVPVALTVCMMAAGGTGNILSLAVLCIRSKSKQLKAIGKMGVVPALFNINEPMAFGVPIMYNPIIAIPFILNPLVIMLISIPLFQMGIFQPQVMFSMSVLPIFLSDYVTTLHIGNLLIPVLAFVVSYIIYLPFVKVYDKQLCEKEAAEEENA